MKYMTCAEAHSLWGITVRRIQQMCKNGDIRGAIKEGKSWLIPRDTVCPTFPGSITTVKKEASSNRSIQFQKSNCRLLLCGQNAFDQRVH